MKYAFKHTSCEQHKRSMMYMTALVSDHLMKQVTPVQIIVTTTTTATSAYWQYLLCASAPRKNATGMRVAWQIDTSSPSRYAEHTDGNFPSFLLVYAHRNKNQRDQQGEDLFFTKSKPIAKSLPRPPKHRQ